MNNNIDTDIDTDILHDDDMIFNKIDGKIQTAGFSVNSILMQKGQPLLITKNSAIYKGGAKNVSDLFKDLAVPAGIAQFNKIQIGGNIEESNFNNDKIISEDLHDKLLKMVEVSNINNSKKTRKPKLKLNNSKTKTKKNYN